MRPRFIVVCLLILVATLQAQNFDLGPQVPEIYLEARTIVYYRPSLLLEEQSLPDLRLEVFQRRLRLALELAGSMEILDHRPDSSTMDASSLELLTELKLVPEEGFLNQEESLPIVASLSQGSESLELQSWPLRLDSESLARQAADLASEVLLLLTGSRPVYASQILYTENSGSGSRLVLADFFGESRQTLAGASSLKLSPTWHPNGRNMAMVLLHPTQGTGVWLGSTDGGRLDVLLDTPESESAPAFSPDGSQLALALSRGGNTDIWLLPVDPESGQRRGDARRLTRSPGIDTNPAWSPDGRHLVFSSDRSGTLQIYRIGVNGLDEQRLTFLGGASDCPAWSPDGEWILFVSRERQGFQLFQMRPDGSDWVRLSDQSGNHFDPCWSPDSRLIAFNWRGDSWIARADGSERRKISTGSGESPAWRPQLLPTAETEVQVP